MVEGRLFSEGLHVLGQPPSEDHMRQYLAAYFDGDLPEEAVDALATTGNDVSVDAVRQRLERSYEQVWHSCWTLFPVEGHIIVHAMSGTHG